MDAISLTFLHLHVIGSELAIFVPICLHTICQRRCHQTCHLSCQDYAWLGAVTPMCYT